MKKSSILSLCVLAVCVAVTIVCVKIGKKQHKLDPFITHAPTVEIVYVSAISILPQQTVSIEDEPTELPTESPTEEITETPTDEPMPTSTPTPEPIVESRNDDGWMPYLATSYSAHKGAVGNRGAKLDGRNVIAMWQSDMDYSTYTDMIEPFRSFFRRTDGVEYGSLPYGTDVEMRIWTGRDYEYCGIYTVLDDSPTTQYNLSNVAVNLHGDSSPLYFKFNWTDTNYRGQPANGGARKGQITNWKPDYSYNVKGWIDVLGANWGMVIVEIKIL